MLKVHNIQPFGKTNMVRLQKQNETNLENMPERGSLLMGSLNSMAGINRVSFTGKYDGFEIGLTPEEMNKRLDPEYTRTHIFMDIDSPYYTNLAQGDQKALGHLVKSAEILKDVHLVLDNENNLPFRNVLEHKTRMGDKNAATALNLFTQQQGASKYDGESTFFSLIKGEKPLPGKGFYPKDLEKEEFHNILINMLKDGRKDEVQELLSNRTIVQRDGKGALKAVDYTDVFKKEFTAAADELDKAAKVSTNKEFSEFLRLQSVALRTNNQYLDAVADNKWALLQDTPLEYTITRENYEDEMTGSVVENKELKALLKKNKIEAVSKDSLGIRVGIVDKEGTKMLLDFKKYLPMMAQYMPLSDKYEQNISSNAAKEIKQTMVDARLVYVTGDGAGAVLAENLPNNDKVKHFELGGGRRNVYHADCREVTNKKALQQKLDAIFDQDFIKYYNNDANHWFVIGHENGHSLGPIRKTPTLGKFESVIEENKADMVSISMIDDLKAAGKYNETQKKEIITTFVSRLFRKAKPISKDAHGVQAIMQINYMQKHGAIAFDEKGLVHINFDKVVPVTRKMLTEIIEVQMSGKYADGKKYVKENFVWSKEIATIAQRIKSINKALDNRIEAPLAKKLLRMAR